MNTEQLYIIWSIEHDAWWCPLERGYTKERRNAGTYTYAEAKRIVDGANIGNKDVPNEAMIPLGGVVSLRGGDGSLKDCDCNVGMPRAHEGYNGK